MKQVKIEGFTIKGPSVRTNNQAEGGPDAKIGGLWGHYFGTCVNPEAKAYGVYSDYESDATGDFTVTAGAKVDGNTEGETLAIAPGTYLAFPATGPVPAAIIDAWQAVWGHFARPQAYTRAYATDFEEYSGPESATVYIGITTTAD